MAGGGGFGPGHGATYGYLFDAVSTNYTISSSTIADDAATGGSLLTTTGEYQTNSFGGGVFDGDPTFGYNAFYNVYYVSHDANVALYSTIVANNSADDALYLGHNVEPADIVGGTSDSHNLIGQSDLSAPNFPTSTFVGSPGVPQPNTNGDLVDPDPMSDPIDPGLSGTLAYNGGPTETLVPLSGGLAIDNGQNSGWAAYSRRRPPTSAASRTSARMTRRAAWR